MDGVEEHFKIGTMLIKYIDRSPFCSDFRTPLHVPTVQGSAIGRLTFDGSHAAPYIDRARYSRSGVHLRSRQQSIEVFYPVYLHVQDICI
jgi:hypothetical protein